MNKQTIYILHVPKCGGTTVLNCLKSIVPEYIKNIFYGQIVDHKKIDLNDYSVIQGHFGNYPLSKVNNLHTAFLARNPVDRCLSNFSWLMMNQVLDFNENYKDLNSIEKKLKYYLFEDAFYSEHRNLQARHLCNGIENHIFNYKYNFLYLEDKDRLLIEEYKDKMDYIEKSKNWYIKDKNTSFKNAKEQISKLKVLGTTEKVYYFVEEVINLFNSLNTNIKLNNLNIDYIKYNESKINFNNKIIKTNELKSLLSKKEIKKIEENNQIDMEIWKYLQSMI